MGSGRRGSVFRQSRSAALSRRARFANRAHQSKLAVIGGLSRFLGAVAEWPLSEQPVGVKDDMPRSVSRRASRHSNYDVLGSRFLAPAVRALSEESRAWNEVTNTLR